MFKLTETPNNTAETLSRNCSIEIHEFSKRHKLTLDQAWDFLELFGEDRAEAEKLAAALDEG